MRQCGVKHPKKVRCVLNESAQVKYAFVAQHKLRQQHSLQTLLRVLYISRSGYYDWLKREPSKREEANAKLLGAIQVVHSQYRQAYGAIKTWRHLNNNGISCGKHRVARLRREAGIEAKRKARFRVTLEHHKIKINGVRHDLFSNPMTKLL